MILICDCKPFTIDKQYFWRRGRGCAQNQFTLKIEGGVILDISKKISLNMNVTWYNISKFFLTRNKSRHQLTVSIRLYVIDYFCTLMKHCSSELWTGSLEIHITWEVKLNQNCRGSDVECTERRNQNIL